MALAPPKRNDAWAVRNFADRDLVIDPIHPGEILLEDFLKPMGLSQNQLALGTSLPSSRINGIVKGTRGISAETVLRFSRYFGTSAAFWMNLQTHHDLHEVRPLELDSHPDDVFISATDRFPE